MEIENKEKALVPVPGYDFYFVDLEKGEIYSTIKGYVKKLNPCANTAGYYTVRLYDGERNAETYFVHCVVMAAKQQMPINEWRKVNLTVHHRNENIADNWSDNLELLTSSAQFTTELKQRLSALRLGKPSRKLSVDEVLQIRKEFSETDEKVTPFCQKIAEKFNVTYTNVYYIVTGRSWKHLLPNCNI